jgi:DNA-binding transcriptional MerR regulator
MRNSQEQKEGTGKLYYSISEVSELVNVKAHVLRYWETQFKMLHPRKNRAGNRSYRIKDVKMALRIKKLLYDEGFTIAGARRKLLDERKSGEAQTELDFVGISRDDFLKILRRDLTELLQMVQGERSVASLGRRGGSEESDAATVEPGRAGIFSDLDLGADEVDNGEETGSGATTPGVPTPGVPTTARGVAAPRSATPRSATPRSATPRSATPRSTAPPRGRE